LSYLHIEFVVAMHEENSKFTHNFSPRTTTQREQNCKNFINVSCDEETFSNALERKMQLQSICAVRVGKDVSHYV
jgi:hypothetical protein